MVTFIKKENKCPQCGTQKSLKKKVIKSKVTRTILECNNCRFTILVGRKEYVDK